MLTLKHQLDSIAQSDERLVELDEEIEKAKESYLELAKQLSISRQKAALKLSKLVTNSLADLSMETAQFEISVTQQETNFSSKGLDSIDFLVATNTGQQKQTLAKGCVRGRTFAY